jgi:hypothetical protein
LTCRIRNLRLSVSRIGAGLIGAQWDDMPGTLSPTPRVAAVAMPDDVEAAQPLVDEVGCPAFADTGR